MDVNGFEYLVAGVLPWVLAVVTGVYFAWRLASRRALRVADWVIGSLAIAGLIYLPEVPGPAPTATCSPRWCSPSRC